MNIKEIHIGKLIQQKVEELNISKLRICNFLNCNYEDVLKMYQEESIETHFLLRWSKLLEYDFFRIYTGHLILYAPCKSNTSENNKENNSHVFRKNIYTQEVKNFILEIVNEKSMTIGEIIEKYKIPRTTLYKWIKKANL